MDKQDKQASKSEVELKRLKYSFWKHVVESVSSIVKFLLGVPIGYFVWKMVETLAGKTTTVSVSFITKVSIVVSAALVAAVGVALAKMSQQKKELVRCRERIVELEKRVSDTQNSENES